MRGLTLEVRISWSVEKMLAVKRQALIYLKVLVKTAQWRKSLLFSPILFSMSTLMHHFFLARASK
jgi:hypothetical protein